jgi:hypothetical protein
MHECLRPEIHEYRHVNIWRPTAIDEHFRLISLRVCCNSFIHRRSLYFDT